MEGIVHLLGRTRREGASRVRMGLFVRGELGYEGLKGAGGI